MMRRVRQHASGVVLLALSVVLLADDSRSYLRSQPSLWFRSNGFHTALLLPRVPHPGLPPHPEARWYDCSWGDSAYFTTPGDPPLGLTLKALFWPTPTVLHVRPLTEAAREDWSRSETFIELRLDSGGFEALHQFVARSFACDSAGKLQTVGDGWGSDARFYRARGRYTAFYTCNSWTADALRAAGLRLPRWDLTAPPLERSLRRRYGPPAR